MKRKLILALFSLLVVFSCQEKEDPIPTNLIGTWELVFFDPTNELESINRYIFRPDRTFSNEWSFREVGGTEDIGIQQVINGNFETSGEEIIFINQEIFLSPSHINTPPFGRREDLIKNTTGGENTSRFEISEDGGKLTLFAASGFQGSDATYEKVPLR